MPNHMKFCGCRACRWGMHHTARARWVRRLVRSFRRKTKEALRAGHEPPRVIHVPYTD